MFCQNDYKSMGRLNGTGVMVIPPGALAGNGQFWKIYQN